MYAALIEIWTIHTSFPFLVVLTLQAPHQCLSSADHQTSTSPVGIQDSLDLIPGIPRPLRSRWDDAMCLVFQLSCSLSDMLVKTFNAYIIGCGHCHRHVRPFIYYPSNSLIHATLFIPPLLLSVILLIKSIILRHHTTPGSRLSVINVPFTSH